MNTEGYCTNSRRRLKELECINSTTSILRESKPVEESLHQIAMMLPAAWQYPEYTVARIRFMGNELRICQVSEKQNGEWPGFYYDRW
jgi:hypothetical protein